MKNLCLGTWIDGDKQGGREKILLQIIYFKVCVKFLNVKFNKHVKKRIGI